MTNGYESARTALAFVWLSFTEVLYPLLVISLALFMSIGFALTLLMPVTIAHWQIVFWLTLLPPLAMLALRAFRMWQQWHCDFPRITWRVLLPLLPLLILTPTVFLELTDPTLQVRAHLDIHGAYI